MAHINLLPWRSELRRKRQQQFLIGLAIVAIVGVASVYGVMRYYADQISFQSQRNAYLQQEIKLLDKKITEIKQLDEIRAAVINRIQIIQELQQLRPQVVHLFDEVVDTLPDGIYLTRLEQIRGTEVTQLEGFAQSNARVSSYMRELDGSDWLSDPNLVIVTAVELPNGTRSSQFQLRVREENPLQKKADAEAAEKLAADNEEGGAP